ncbi:MAG: hypothetical protein V3V78_00815 [Candidatus Woesearchaeota archaeon]
MAEMQEEHKKKGFSLFGKKKEEEAGPNVMVAIQQVNEVARRLRILESRYTDLSRKEQVTEKNMLGERKRFTTELKALDSEVLDLKREFNEIKTKMDTIIGGLNNLAAKEEVEALKKYIELWEPINFATREEVEKIVKEALE